MSNFLVLIPARLGSTRVAEKMLLEAGGVPLVVHTWRRGSASEANRVVICADHERIAAAARAHDAEVVLTGPADTGTERLAEASRRLELDDDTIVVNLQGDEPDMPASVINALAAELAAHPEAALATACCPVDEPGQLHDPNVVKVVVDGAGNALYFSRATIPFVRDETAAPANHLRHLGIYAYRVKFLRRFAAWPPAPNETVEKLEQLRALHYGCRIRMLFLDQPTPPGIDTESDWQAFAARTPGS